jgi:hypothetical protein
MLSVSVDVMAVVAMLVSIVSGVSTIEVDSLNSPTTRPSPSGNTNM